MTGVILVAKPAMLFQAGTGNGIEQIKPSMLLQAGNGTEQIKPSMLLQAGNGTEQITNSTPAMLLQDETEKITNSSSSALEAELVDNSGPKVTWKQYIAGICFALIASFSGAINGFCTSKLKGKSIFNPNPYANPNKINID